MLHNTQHHKDMVRRKQIASEKKICFAITIPLLQSIYNSCFYSFCIFMLSGSKAPDLMPTNYFMLRTPTILPNIRISWDYHPTFTVPTLPAYIL